MMLTRSLLLGTAAGLFAVSAVQAADLPFKKSVPVEYVRICDSHGQGFFYIPGTDTCLKVGGNVEYDYQVFSRKSTIAGYSVPAVAGVRTGAVTLGAKSSYRNYNLSGQFARGRVEVDARDATPWGTLRTFSSLQIDYKTGDAASAGAPGVATTAPSINKAYIQWAGLTAGRFTSVFDFYADYWNHIDLDDSDATVNGLAYTATFGNGFLATLSFEGRADRLGSYSAGATGLAVNTEGEVIPDIVGQLNYSQSWGQVQASGAAHQEGTFLSAVAGTGFPNANSSKWGYAGQLGVEFNLPMFGPSDQLWLEGSYVNGPLAYNQLGSSPNGSTRNFNSNGFIQADYDGIWTGTAATGFQLKMPTSWAVLAAVQHYFTPTIVGRLSGTYVEVHYPAGSALAALTSNFNRLKVGPQLMWQPLPAFNVGVEALYIHLDQKFPVVTPVGTKNEVDSFETTLHIERDF